ncbi:AAA family ATPase [Sphingomonas paucimobilis]|uniref:AAA family ATPase n=1 Tax=Sphingomonas paucimobilis TaxID=13689 RepID=UPI0028D501BE|nr:AAA family ATPase [Sphingomonas paucimobilis]
MSLKIRRIALSNFRKYRDPFVLDGLTDGLNVIIEPNETGKSTLLEAMRAAFFIRHNTANRLARSYAPYGEAVAPQIEIGFDVNRRPKRTPYRRAKGTPFVEQRDGYDGRFVRAGCGVGRA